MGLSQASLQLKPGPQCREHFAVIVLHDVQAAAAGWPANRKGGDNEIAAFFQTGAQSAHIALPVFSIRQEVKQRPVMPERVASIRLEAPHILTQPGYPPGQWAEVFTAGVQRGAGNVKHRDVTEAVVQQRPHQAGCPGANVDQRLLRLQAGGLNQAK